MKNRELKTALYLLGYKEESSPKLGWTMIGPTFIVYYMAENSRAFVSHRPTDVFSHYIPMKNILEYLETHDEPERHKDSSTASRI